MKKLFLISLIMSSLAAFSQTLPVEGGAYEHEWTCYAYDVSDMVSTGYFARIDGEVYPGSHDKKRKAKKAAKSLCREKAYDRCGIYKCENNATGEYILYGV